MSGSSPTLLCVAPYVPWRGIDHAGGEFLRRYLAAATGAGWRVRLIAPASMTNQAALRVQGPSAETVLWPPQESLPARVRNLCSTGVPATTGLRWLRRLPQQALAWLEDATLVDLQWADCLWDAPTLRTRFPDQTFVGLVHDVRTESLRRALVRGSSRARVEAALALVRVRSRERLSLDACDRIFVFKHGDRATLRALGVTTEIELAPVPIPAPASLPEPDPGSQRVLFAGAFFRPENVEGAIWLLDEVMPLVREAVPEVVVRLAGARPPRVLLDRASTGVEVTGYLESMSDAYAGVACVAVPLRRGAGVKFKSAEAVAAGFPLVTTSVGAEGVFDVVATQPSRVHDDPVGFARALMAVLLEPVPALEDARRDREVAQRLPGFEERIAHQLESCRALR